MKFKLNEMAYDRSDAIDRCASLGKQFVKHFDVIFNNPSGQDFKHHCAEMESWLNDVYNIVLKYNNKRISKSQLIDWFFTVGSSIELLFDDPVEIDMYEDFIINILSNPDKSIDNILIDLFDKYEI